MISALVIVLAAWLGFFLFLIGVLAIGEWWARHSKKADPLEWIWGLDAFDPEESQR